MNIRDLVKILLAGLLVAGVLSVMPASASAASGDPSRDFPRIPRACATPKEMIPAKATSCRLTPFEKNRPTIVLWGDSHAWMMIPALRAAIGNQDVNLLAFMMGTCPPMDPRLTRTTRKTAIECAQSNDLALRSVRKLDRGKQPLRVVLGGSWQRYYTAQRTGETRTYVGQMAQRFTKDGPRLFRALGKAGIDVDVVGQVATVPAKAPRCRAGEDPYECDLSRKSALRNEAGVRRWLSGKVRPLSGPTALIDVNPAFCTARVCRGRTGKTFTFFDDLHISATQSRKLRSYFLPTVAGVVPGGGGGGGDGPAQPCLPIIGC